MRESAGGITSRLAATSAAIYSDRYRFLELLSELPTLCGTRIHAYVVMDNHYHLLLETPDPNLVAGMKWLQGTYTQRYNARHELFGHLYQGRNWACP